jgi:hypothetical protein
VSKFLVTYHGSGMPDDPELMEQAKAAFGEWVAKTGDALVDPGAPLMMVTQVATGDATDPVQIGGTRSSMPTRPTRRLRCSGRTPTSRAAGRSR